MPRWRPIAHWKNKWIRRAGLIIALPVAMILLAIGGLFEGFCEWQDTAKSFWNDPLP